MTMAVFLLVEVNAPIDTLSAKFSFRRGQCAYDAVSCHISINNNQQINKFSDKTIFI